MTKIMVFLCEFTVTITVYHTLHSQLPLTRMSKIFWAILWMKMQRCFQEESLVLKMKTSNYFHRMKPKCTCGNVLQELVRSRTSKLCVTQNFRLLETVFSKCHHHGQAYDWLVFHVPTKYFEAGLSCQSSGRRKISMCPSTTTTFKFSADREGTL